MVRPMPIRMTWTSHLFRQDRLEADQMLLRLFLDDELHLTESAMARSSERTVFSTTSASSWRPFRRAITGTRASAVPKNSATAGSTQTPNMIRQMPSTWPKAVPMIALTASWTL